MAKKGNDDNYAVRFNMSLSPVLAEKLEKYAKDNGLPKSTIVSVALSDFFKQRESMENVSSLVFRMFENNPEFLKELLKSEEDK